MQNILNINFLNNSVQDYLIFLGVFIGLFIVFRIFRIIIIKKLEIIFKKTVNSFDDLIIDTISNISKFFY